MLVQRIRWQFSFWRQILQLIPTSPCPRPNVSEVVPIRTITVRRREEDSRSSFYTDGPCATYSQTAIRLQLVLCHRAEDTVTFAAI
jgi:hypothetical protein